MIMIFAKILILVILKGVFKNREIKKDFMNTQNVIQEMKYMEYALGQRISKKD